MTETAVSDAKAGINPTEVDKPMYELVRELYPICRSITGNGVRETLRQVGGVIDIAPRATNVGEHRWPVALDQLLKRLCGGQVLAMRCLEDHRPVGVR